MSSEYVTKLIRRAVDANTTENAPTSSRALNKYFGDPKLAEIAYVQVIQRAESASNRKNTQQILLKCIRLLKQQLPRHHPSDETLLLLDRFAHRVQQQFPEAFQSLEYIRALLEAISKTRHSSSSSSSSSKKRSDKATDGKSSKKPAGGALAGNSNATGGTLSTPDKRSGGTGNGGSSSTVPGGTLDAMPGPIVRFKAGSVVSSPQPSGTSSKKRSSKPKSSSRYSTSRASEARRGPLIPNLLLLRSRARPLAAKSTALSGSSANVASLVGSGGTVALSLADSIRRDLESSLQSAPLFGGQFENLRLDAREIFTVHDGELVHDRILTVGMSKKNEERAMYRSFRRAAPLFQYKHYKDQSRLQLAPKQLDEIINAMLNPQSDNRLVASKIFIKLILDAYCQDGTSVATAALTSLVMEMLESSHLEVQCHAFNMVFNLSVHVNMFEEIPFFDPVHPAGSTPMITVIQQELFSVVKEMLKLLVVRGETERRLWFSAMNALLYFATEKGLIDRVRLIGIDYRTFVGFFQYIDYISDAVWRHLVRMLLNKLYMEGTIDMTAFTTGALSIDFLVRLYKDSRSLEARDNLFVTIYDYIGECYLRRVRAEYDESDSETEGSSDEENNSRAGRERAITQQLSLCLELLRLIDAPQYFVQVFKVPSFDFCYATLSFVRLRAATNPAIAELWNAIDQSPSGLFQQIVLGDIFKLAMHCSQVDESVSQRISRAQTVISNAAQLTMMESRPDTSGAAAAASNLKNFELDSLAKLLQSTDERDNEYGVKWLFSLKKALLDVALTVALSPRAAASAASASPASSASSTSSAFWSSSPAPAPATSSGASGGSNTSHKTSTHGHHHNSLHQHNHNHGHHTHNHSHSVGSTATSSSADTHTHHGAHLEHDSIAAASPRTSSPSLLVESGPLLALSNEVESLYHGLAKSSAPTARRMYLAVLENLLIHIRSKSAPGSENRIVSAMFELVNDGLSRLVDLGERSETVLMSMFDVLLSVVGILPGSQVRYRGGSALEDALLGGPRAGSAGSGSLLFPPSSRGRIDPFALPQLDDSLAGLFMLGKVTIPLRLLRKVKIHVIHHIFFHLPPRYTSQMRPVLLYLLIERCKESKEDADAIGGTAFFKKLLAENDPQISFLASRYLIDTLQKEKPDHFVDIVNTLLARAVEAYDERLVSNPYLQIKAILQMQDTVSPAKLGPISALPPPLLASATTPSGAGSAAEKGGGSAPMGVGGTVAGSAGVGGSGAGTGQPPGPSSASSGDKK